MSEQPRFEYIEARRVLLDALGALSGQLAAVVLVGAQAVYLRTTDRLPSYQPFTTDADIVLDPSLLTDQPALGDVMRGAGFVLTAEPGIWEARFRREGFADDVVVPVDLIVPMHVAAGPGRRSARLTGDHGKHSARKSEGLEGALVDHGPVEITAIDPADERSIVINVAGEAAMLVAKLHKLGDRLEKPGRLDAKDAGDVYRLFDVIAPDDMATRLKRLLDDERSAGATMKAIAYGEALFAPHWAPEFGSASMPYEPRSQAPPWLLSSRDTGATCERLSRRTDVGRHRLTAAPAVAHAQYSSLSDHAGRPQSSSWTAPSHIGTTSGVSSSPATPTGTRSG